MITCGRIRQMMERLRGVREQSRLSGFGHEMINNEAAGFAVMPDDQVGFR